MWLYWVTSYADQRLFLDNWLHLWPQVLQVIADSSLSSVLLIELLIWGDLFHRLRQIKWLFNVVLIFIITFNGCSSFHKGRLGFFHTLFKSIHNVVVLEEELRLRPLIHFLILKRVLVFNLVLALLRKFSFKPSSQFQNHLELTTVVHLFILQNLIYARFKVATARLRWVGLYKLVYEFTALSWLQVLAILTWLGKSGCRCVILVLGRVGAECTTYFFEWAIHFEFNLAILF
jgi:hypothetical protein